MTEIEEGSGNIYADLGLPDADEMFVKAQLAARIAEAIAAKGWTQQRAAAVVGLPQPKLSNILRGQFRGVSESKLMDCLIRLGCEVRILVGPALPNVQASRVTVVSAL